MCTLSEPLDALPLGQELAKWPFSLQLKHLTFLACTSPVGLSLCALLLLGIASIGVFDVFLVCGGSNLFLLSIDTVFIPSVTLPTACMILVDCCRLCLEDSRKYVAVKAV